MKKLFALIAALAVSISIGASASERGTVEEAQALVKKAVAYYDKNGREKALLEFQKQPGPFVDRDLYVNVYDMEGTCLAHINTKTVGKNMIELRDSDGIYILKDRVAAAHLKTSGWQDYKFYNPLSKKIEPKHMYWEKHDNLIFAAGAYKTQ